MFRNKRFALRLTPKEESALEQITALQGSPSQSAIIRQMIRTKTKELGIWTPPDTFAFCHQSIEHGKRETL